MKGAGASLFFAGGKPDFRRISGFFYFMKEETEWM